jgi:hypothetical protein
MMYFLNFDLILNKSKIFVCFKMNEIVEKIDSCESFEELGNLIQSKEIIRIVYDFYKKIDSQDIERSQIIRNSKFTLAAFLVNKFPSDTLSSFDTTGITYNGEISVSMSPEATAVNDKATQFTNLLRSQDLDNLSYSNSEQIKNIFNQFKILFDNWKDNDYESLKHSIIEEYHHLSVSIMNLHDQESKSQSGSEESTDQDNAISEQIVVLKECQEELLKTARMLGGDELVELIGQYAPIVIDTENLIAQYSAAFWDVLYEDYVEKKYEKIFVVLEHIIKLFETIYSDQNTKITELHEKIDIEFIKQRLQHNAYENEQMFGLCNYIIDECCVVQAPEFDAVVDELRSNITSENFLPRFLREITLILQLTVDELLKFRQVANQDHPDASD